jgi:hypothetical protein
MFSNIICASQYQQSVEEIKVQTLEYLSQNSGALFPVLLEAINVSANNISVQITDFLGPSINDQCTE